METRTYADRREYLIGAVKRRRRRLREMAVEYKGGRCVFCGYHRDIAALDFHHLDGSDKDFGLSQRGLTRSWERIKLELDKCILVCANCHREVHSGVLKVADVVKYKGSFRVSFPGSSVGRAGSCDS